MPTQKTEEKTVPDKLNGRAFIILGLITLICFGAFCLASSRATANDSKSPTTTKQSTPAAKLPGKVPGLDDQKKSATPTPATPAPQPKAATPRPKAEAPAEVEPEEKSVSAPIRQIAVAIPCYRPGDKLTVTMDQPKVGSKKQGYKEIGSETVTRTLIVMECSKNRLWLYESRTGKYADWITEFDWPWVKDNSGCFTMRPDPQSKPMAQGTFQVGFMSLPGKKVLSNTTLTGWMSYTTTFRRGRHHLRMELVPRT